MKTILPLLVTSISISLSLLALGQETSAQVEAAPSTTPTVKEIRLNACPQGVQAAIAKATESGELDDIKVITKGDVTTYLVDIDFPNHLDRELTLSTDGKILEIREELNLEQAPAAVKTALTSLAAGAGDIEDVKCRVVGDETTYLAEIDRNGIPDLDVELDGEGKVLSQTEEVED